MRSNINKRNAPCEADGYTRSKKGGDMRVFYPHGFLLTRSPGSELTTGMNSVIKLSWPSLASTSIHHPHIGYCQSGLSCSLHGPIVSLYKKNTKEGIDFPPPNHTNTLTVYGCGVLFIEQVARTSPPLYWASTATITTAHSYRLR